MIVSPARSTRAATGKRFRKASSVSGMKGNPSSDPLSSSVSRISFGRRRDVDVAAPGATSRARPSTSSVRHRQPFPKFGRGSGQWYQLKTRRQDLRRRCTLRTSSNSDEDRSRCRDVPDRTEAGVSPAGNRHDPGSGSFVSSQTPRRPPATADVTNDEVAALKMRRS